ncbi:Crp/Fnr family transcriptional regulator [Ahniella affigens]|nr:helix-turn-helix domain-containing protein [Ahniella affigens]
MQATAIAGHYSQTLNLGLTPSTVKAPTVELPGAALNLACRRLEARQPLYLAGQPVLSLFLIRAGQMKTSVVSHDGRELITGFRMRGDWLGLESLDTDFYACDAVALEFCEVLELPRSRIDALQESHPNLKRELTSTLSQEIRRDWQWMLRTATLAAEQRVAAFLLDLASRQRALGFSARRLTLRMTRAELGSFLAITLETVTRVMSRMAEHGVISVQRRDVELLDPDALGALAGGTATYH